MPPQHVSGGLCWVFPHRILSWPSPNSTIGEERSMEVHKLKIRREQSLLITTDDWESHRSLKQKRHSPHTQEARHSQYIYKLVRQLWTQKPKDICWCCIHWVCSSKGKYYPHSSAPKLDKQKHPNYESRKYLNLGGKLDHGSKDRIWCEQLLPASCGWECRWTESSYLWTSNERTYYSVMLGTYRLGKNQRLQVLEQRERRNCRWDPRLWQRGWVWAGEKKQKEKVGERY